MLFNRHNILKKSLMYNDLKARFKEITPLFGENICFAVEPYFEKYYNSIVFEECMSQLKDEVSADKVVVILIGDDKSNLIDFYERNARTIGRIPCKDNDVALLLRVSDTLDVLSLKYDSLMPNNSYFNSVLMSALFQGEYSQFLSKKGSDMLSDAINVSNVSILNRSALISKECEDDLIDEMISKVDITAIRSLFVTNVRNMGRVNIPISIEECRQYLRHWAKSKLPLYLMLDRNLIVEKVHRFSQTESMAQSQVNELKRDFPQYAPLLQLFHCNDIIKNRNRLNTSSEELIECLAHNPDMKLSKFLSQIIPNDGDINKKFHTRLSQIIQSQSIDCSVALSIHPIDYLTSAFNMNNWNSCHHFLKKDRANGCLSFMLDSSTIVSYIHNGKIYDYKSKHGCDLRWTSKMYRQLISINTRSNAFISQRLYPQHSMDEDIRKYIREFVEELISDFCQISNSWKFTTKGVVCKYTNHSSSSHYDDLPHNLVHSVRHSDGVYGIMNIGAPALCIKCGSIMSQNSHHKSICVCESCRNIF